MTSRAFSACLLRRENLLDQRDGLRGHAVEGQVVEFTVGPLAAGVGLRGHEERLARLPRPAAPPPLTRLPGPAVRPALPATRPRAHRDPLPRRPPPLPLLIVPRALLRLIGGAHAGRRTRTVRWGYEPFAPPGPSCAPAIIFW